MTSQPPDPAAAIRFAENALQLLEQGGFVATYKYAVLLGLMDLCLEGTGRDGVPPAMVTTRQLAEKVIALYWPQTRPWPMRDHGLSVLRQSTGNQARIVADIRAFRDDPSGYDGDLHGARLTSGARMSRLVDQVEWTLIAMPLPRLQVIGRQHRELIYRIAWDQGIEKRKRVVTGYQRAHRDGRAADSSGFDNRIHLLPDVGEYLVLLNGLLRPLIHREWARLVAQVNRLDHTRLEGFLFGMERVPTGKVQAGLRDLQGDRCFYCDGHLRGATEVDHFIPWSRHPDNAIENLVVADRLCNGDKRDLLAAPEHLARWAARLDPGGTQATDLAHLAHAERWESARDRTLGVVRGLYLRLRDDALLWRGRSDLVPADPSALHRVLTAA